MAESYWFAWDLWNLNINNKSHEKFTVIVNSRVGSLSTTRSTLKINMVANSGEKMIKLPVEKLN